MGEPLPRARGLRASRVGLAERNPTSHAAGCRSPQYSRLDCHILPALGETALGRLPLPAVERSHVMAMHESLCEIPAMANMALALGEGLPIDPPGPVSASG